MYLESTRSTKPIALDSYDLSLVPFVLAFVGKMNDTSFMFKTLESMPELYTHHDPFAARPEEPEMGSSTFLEFFKSTKSRRRKNYNSVATPVPRRRPVNAFSRPSARLGNKRERDGAAGSVKLSKAPLSKVQTVTSAFKLDLNVALLKQSLRRAVDSPGKMLYVRCLGVWFQPSRSPFPYKMKKLYTCPQNWKRCKPSWQEVCI